MHIVCTKTTENYVDTFECNSEAIASEVATPGVFTYIAVIITLYIIHSLCVTYKHYFIRIPVVHRYLRRHEYFEVELETTSFHQEQEPFRTASLEQSEFRNNETNQWRQVHPSH